MPAAVEWRLRVATYNIHRCLGRDRQIKPERIAEVLSDIDADVVALQEVAVASTPGGDVLDFLSSATGMKAIEGFTLLEKTGRYGNAVLARVDAASVQRIDLSVTGREPRGLLDVRMLFHGHSLALLATHLGLRPSERRRQSRRILTHLDTVSADTTIVLGDFNEWLSWGRPLRQLNRRLGPSPGLPTFPARRPLVAIDRLWVHPPNRLRGLRTHATALTSIASDHLPLVADLDLPSPDQSD